MGILTKVINTFNVLITEIEKSVVKFIWKHKRQQIAKAILSKKSSAGGITTPKFKLYCRAIAIKTSGTGTKTNGTE
jgi:hypothetical protein